MFLEQNSYGNNQYHLNNINQSSMNTTKVINDCIHSVRNKKIKIIYIG